MIDFVQKAIPGICEMTVAVLSFKNEIMICQYINQECSYIENPFFFHVFAHNFVSNRIDT
jgi:hypothetical protein